MPSDTYGFSGTDLVAHVQSYIGNQSAELQTYLQNSLPLAEMRFCKAHDWSFLTKTDLALTVTSGTSLVTLSVATLGFYVAASDVKQIFSPAGNLTLVKTSVDVIRRMDPDENDGTVTSHITHWAPVGDNTIMVYPPVFVDTVLKVDAKVTPVALSTLSNYPTIPYRYQESFIEYLKWIALDKENDDRANAKMDMSKKLIMADIQDDLSGLGDVDLNRIKHAQEARMDGIASNVESLYNLWAFNSNE